MRSARVERREESYRRLTQVSLQLQQYKVSGHPSKVMEDRPKENGQADEGQQQNKVSTTDLSVRSISLDRIRTCVHKGDHRYSHTHIIIASHTSHRSWDKWKCFKFLSESREMHLWKLFSLCMLMFSICSPSALPPLTSPPDV